MSEINIVFSPYSLYSNKYVKIIISCLKQNNNDVNSISELLSNFEILKKSQIIHLNWYEILGNRNYILRFLEFIKKICLLIFLKAIGKKIVWTMHNKFPHDTYSYDLQWILMKSTILFSDLIIIHCNLSKEVLTGYSFKIVNKEKILSKVKYVPHPNYINEYGKIIPSKTGNKDVLSLLFIGAIRPYKNIELLIDTVKTFGSNEVSLKIIGKPISENYKENLINKSINQMNINLDLRFIPDEEIAEIISDCDLFILPYDIQSSLNSGTIFLAFSYKKTVICPEIGTILDFDKTEIILSYRYISPNEHFTILKEKISEAIFLKKQNTNIFNEMGEKVYKHVITNHSHQKISRELSLLYSNLIN